MSLTVDEITVPSSPGAGDADRFTALVDVRNAVEIHTLGTDLLTPSVAELVPEYRDNPSRRRRHLLASADGEAVGRAIVTTRPRSPGAGAHVQVDVLPGRRGEGIGTTLLDLATQMVLDEGETVVKAQVQHAVVAGGRRIVPPTGFGEVPADDPGVRFLSRHGYSLEQVTRTSLLDTAGLVLRMDELLAGAGAGANSAAVGDYRLHSWVGPTPADRLDDLATLRTRMSTDTPMAGLASPPDPWDADRVVAHDARAAEHAENVLTTAALHVPSGRLVGFTEIVVPPDRAAATQEDTLVLREHRGHRLGLLMKAANARDLVSRVPRIEAVVTWNAEENRPMLDINERMGFRPIGYEGGWLKQA